MAAAGAAHRRLRQRRPRNLSPTLSPRHSAPADPGGGTGRHRALSRAGRRRRRRVGGPGACVGQGDVLRSGEFRLNVASRLFSLIVLVAAWYVGSEIAGQRMMPGPQTVGLALWAEAQSGALAFHLGATLARVAVAFIIAMAIGTALGVWMGRSRLADRLADPWLVALLNLPALVIIELAYVWAGLTETAAIIAVALNKLPIATVTVREGARALDHTLTEMATVLRMGRWQQLRHLVLPQLASLVWKIALIVELLGRPNGVGFEIGVAFQLFDVT